jgi:pimeloyl-ACP methyl ester carboxylesterase
MAALVFDYRCFGASDGDPRQLFTNKAQLEDWRAAIAQARRLDGVNPDRIALWGTSTSGGHVVQLAAEDQRIAAVVAQVPLVDGLAQLFNTPLRQSIRLLWAGLKDRVGALAGRRPQTIPAAGRPGSLAAVTSPDAVAGLARMTPPKTTWRNEVVARFTLSTALYRPGRLARRVRCPALICVADGDELIPSGPALKMVAAMNGGAQLRRYPVGHFAMYVGPGFERAVADQTTFLERYLAVRS